MSRSGFSRPIAAHSSGVTPTFSIKSVIIFAIGVVAPTRQLRAGFQRSPFDSSSACAPLQNYSPGGSPAGNCASETATRRLSGTARVKTFSIEIVR